MPKEIEVRDREEIQIAHDLLSCLLDGIPNFPISILDAYKMMIATDVLCWVLKHDHNSTFADVLQSLKDDLETAGIKMQTLTPEQLEERERLGRML